MTYNFPFHYVYIYIYLLYAINNENFKISLKYNISLTISVISHHESRKDMEWCEWRTIIMASGALRVQDWSKIIQYVVQNF